MNVSLATICTYVSRYSNSDEEEKGSIQSIGCVPPSNIIVILCKLEGGKEAIGYSKQYGLNKL